MTHASLGGIRIRTCGLRATAVELKMHMHNWDLRTSGMAEWYVRVVQLRICGHDGIGEAFFWANKEFKVRWRSERHSGSLKGPAII